MQSVPYITAADPLPQTTTSFINTTTPVVSSQIVQSTPAVAPQVSYVPVSQVSAVPQPVVPKKPVSSGVKVVPIYDDF